MQNCEQKAYIYNNISEQRRNVRLTGILTITAYDTDSKQKKDTTSKTSYDARWKYKGNMSIFVLHIYSFSPRDWKPVWQKIYGLHLHLGHT